MELCGDLMSTEYGYPNLDACCNLQITEEDNMLFIDKAAWDLWMKRAI